MLTYLLKGENVQREFLELAGVAGMNINTWNVCLFLVLNTHTKKHTHTHLHKLRLINVHTYTNTHSYKHTPHSRLVIFLKGGVADFEVGLRI